MRRTRDASVQVRQKRKGQIRRKEKKAGALQASTRGRAPLDPVVQKRGLKPLAALRASQEAVNRRQIVARSSTAVKARFLAYDGRIGKIGASCGKKRY